jgi:Domain of unknown function (DUF6458)
MGIGVSLILIAVGAVLTWAVEASVSGVDINAVGVILMIVGAVGLLLSLMFWSSWGGYGVARGGGGGARRITTYEEGPPPGY